MNKKMKDLKDLNESELKNKLEEMEKELIKENAQAAIGTAVKNPAKIGNMKKNRARILFLLHVKNQKTAQTSQLQNTNNQKLKQGVSKKA